jgi:hypothetical protein
VTVRITPVRDIRHYPGIAIQRRVDKADWGFAEREALFVDLGFGG